MAGEEQLKAMLYEGAEMVKVYCQAKQGKHVACTTICGHLFMPDSSEHQHSTMPHVQRNIL